MIGDNPKSDIDGANRLGWTSILVKTGVFDPLAPTSINGNDKEHRFGDHGYDGVCLHRD